MYVSRLQFDQAGQHVPTPEKWREHPHACIAWSEAAATWGSAETSRLTDTDVPSSDSDFAQGSDIDFEDD